MNRWTLALLISASVTELGCDANRTLTGVEAQRAFVNARSALQREPQDAQIFINGKALIPGFHPEGLDPETITRIEVVKRSGGSGPIFRIWTTDTAAAARLTAQ